MNQAHPRLPYSFICALFAPLLAGAVHAAAPGPDGQMHVYFGDLHLHTSYSLDAATVQTRITPDEAYRFARGEPVDYFGKQVKRNAPLDFLAVTDHAEYLGNVRLAKQGKIQLMGNDWQRLFNNNGGDDM